MKNKIKILGQVYTIRRDTERKDPKLVDALAYVEVYAKEIVLDEADYSNDARCVKKFGLLQKKALRHEIIHAFFHEAGLGRYCNDEVIVDFIAIQFPKLLEIFKQLKVEE